MVKKITARCWLYVSFLGCYIFQIRVSFLNTTSIFFKNSLYCIVLYCIVLYSIPISKSLLTDNPPSAGKV